MNDAGPQRNGELIPDGTFAKVRLTIRPGGTDGQSDMDRGLLKASNSPGSDVLMLDAEFTVMEGPHARRKFWQKFTVSGGKVDDQGVSIGWKISKSTFRAMIDSALGLDPDNSSEDAKTKRVLRCLADLDGIAFVAKIKIEPSDNPQYKDFEQDRPGDPSQRSRMAQSHGRRQCSAQPQHAREVQSHTDRQGVAGHARMDQAGATERAQTFRSDDPDESEDLARSRAEARTDGASLAQKIEP